MIVFYFVNEFCSLRCLFDCGENSPSQLRLFQIFFFFVLADARYLSENVSNDTGRARWLPLLRRFPFSLSPLRSLSTAGFSVHQLSHSKGRHSPDPHLRAWLSSGGKSRPVILCYCAVQRVNKSCSRLQRTLTPVVLADSTGVVLPFHFIPTACIHV